MTINVFLNEKCKDAMNLTDFVDQLKVTLQDLEYTREQGYIKGISNIFTKHLIDLKPTERPIHCSDRKRMQFYIKDEDKWEKDNLNLKINNTIKKVEMKQIKHLKEWENQHPNYLTDDDLLEEWQFMILEIMGGKDIKNPNEKIKKSIVDVVELKDAMIKMK